MSKRGNLSAALTKFDTRATAPVKNPEPPALTQTKTPLPPSREGKKALTVYFDPEVVRQIKMMSAAEDTTIQALIAEALNDLFAKRGKPHIA